MNTIETQSESDRSREFWDAQVRDHRYQNLDGPGMLLFDDRLVNLRRQREEAVVRRLLCDLFERPSVEVLDAGCGTGRWSFWFAERGANVLGVDFSGEMIGRCLQRQKQVRESGTMTIADSLAFQQGTLADLDASNPVDLIFCGGVLQCLSDQHLKAFVAKAAKLLKPNGMILSRDSVLSKRVDQDGAFPVHYRRAAEYQEVFRDHGFQRTADHRAWIQPQLISKLPTWVPLSSFPLKAAVAWDTWTMTHAPIKWLLPIYQRVTGRGIGAVPDHRFSVYTWQHEYA